MSEDNLHAILVKSHTLRDCARAKFIGAMLAMEESRQSFLLRLSSILCYAEQPFGCRPWRT